jgi:hypothetical protein
MASKKDEFPPTPIPEGEQKDPELLPEDQRMPDPEPVPEPEEPKLHQALPDLEPHEDPHHEDYVEVTAFADRSGNPLTIDAVPDLEPSPEVARVAVTDEEE